MNAEKPLSILRPSKLAWEIQAGLVKPWFSSSIHRWSRVAVSAPVLLLSCRELFLDGHAQRMARTREGKTPPSPFSWIRFSSEKEGIFLHRKWCSLDMVCAAHTGLQAQPRCLSWQTGQKLKQLVQLYFVHSLNFYSH